MIAFGGDEWRDRDGRRRVTVGGENDYTLAWETVYDNHGKPFRVLARQMPRINDQLLQTVFYLYPSVEEAKRGVRVGGTGFFVFIEHPSFPNETIPGHFYAVTCLHVIEEGATVIRLNRWPERTIKPLARNQWIPHPDRVDLAVAHVDFKPTIGTFFRAMPLKQIASQEVFKGWDIGVGDEVMMVGRFSEHDGGDFNVPSVRSGIISMMPHPMGRLAYFKGEDEHEIILAEMRSLFGFSGSPVFWQLPLTPPHLWSIHREKFQRELAPDIIGPWLLGIDCGKFPYDVAVYEQSENAREKKTDYVARTHSGHSVVVPAWELLDFLNSKELAMVREKLDREYEEKNKGKRRFEPDSLVSKMPPEGALTQESFEEALRRASRKVPSPEEDKGKE